MGRYREPLDWLTRRPIAHRGYHDMNREVWENTLSAFDRAIERNFAIECDLHLASDGAPMVFHDEDLGRLCGLPGDISELTSAELALKRVGGTSDSIPSLKKMLAHVAGRVPLLIELKGRTDNDVDFAAAVLEELEGYAGRVALMSFDQRLLRDLIQLRCPYPVGLTAEGAKPETFFIHEDGMSLGLDFISYGIEHLPNPFVEGLRKQGVPVLCWTVRTPHMRQRAAETCDQMTFEGFDPDA